MIEFKFYNGKQVLEEKALFKQMEKVTSSYDFLNKENVLQYLDEESKVCCMFKDNTLTAFAWLALCKELEIAELCWFVTDKNKAKGLESKMLLDKVLEYCKQEKITSVKFNCAEQSWGRIKNADRLFEKYGYKLSENKQDYDVSLDT